VLAALPPRPFKVFQVLPQRRFVELREKARLGGTVIAPDVVDELTFVHGRLNFAIADKSNHPIWLPGGKRVFFD
jgi:hypothetical protein